MRPYVHRNKTDRADAAGLLESARCESIRPVPVKTPEQQGIQGLHRVREFHKAQRNAAINLIRGLLREFRVVIPLGSAKVRPAVLAALEDADNERPTAWRNTLAALLDTIVAVECAMRSIQERLQAFAEADLRSQRLRRAGRHRPDHRDRAERLGRRVRPLSLWPPLRQFARADAARAFQRPCPPTRPRHQTR